MRMNESHAETVDPVVRVSGLFKRYKKQSAVADIDLTVRPGELYGLIGPDGAGKSSLMKALAGVLSYEQGTVEVFGVSIDSEAAAERIKPRIGFMPQGLGLNLYPELTVDENIDFFARLRLMPERTVADRKARLLAVTRLAPFRDRAMKHLSGGMKQKLGVVCSLIHNPELAILDEPTTGVDPVSRRDFWAILTELLQERQMTVLVSTAYMDEASRFHRLSFLSAGRTIASGTPADVQALVKGSIVTVRASPQVSALARLQRDYRQVESVGPLLRAFVPEEDPDCAARCVRSSLADYPLEDLRVDTPEFEDVAVALLIQQEGAGQQAAVVPAPAPPTAAPSAAPPIEARALIRDFGEFRAVDRVSLQVRQGEIFGLLGANGAGKTTVMKMLSGILVPTAGDGWVAGISMREARGTFKERIGYMSQAFSLYLDLTVMENFTLFAGIYGLGARQMKERLAWIVGMAGLSGYESAQTASLPMGVRQRLALGCALVHRPQILFLDEPTSGVDPIGRRRFWQILLRLAREEGVTILVTTHHLTEAEHCDRLAIMYAGRIVLEGSPWELKANAEAEVGKLIEVTTDRPFAAVKLLTEAGMTGVTLFGSRLHLFSHRPEWDTSRLRRCLVSGGIEPEAIRCRPMSLEDVFIRRILSLEKADQPASQETRA